MSKIPKILVINGPNLNLLGRREPEIYGSMTLDEINGEIDKYSSEKGCAVEFYQSNSEGLIIDQLHSTIDNFDGIIINPGAYTHYSYAIADAILAVGLPTVEIHISDINAREEFRKISVIKPVCIKQISGLGWKGYLKAIDTLFEYLQNN